MTETATSGVTALTYAAIDSGVSVITGYPGSPITAVMNSLVEQTDEGLVSVEWCANEKVAVEIALGASIAGVRSLVVIKSVGLNVCVDPMMVANLTGTGEGMVILLGDDPALSFRRTTRILARSRSLRNCR